MLWRVRKSTGVVQTGGAENSVLPGNTGATGLNVAEKKGCVKTKRDLDRKYCTVLQNNDVETAQNMVDKEKERQKYVCCGSKRVCGAFESKTAVRGRFGETA